MAALTEEWHLSYQEFGMIASMNFMAAQTVLLNRRMLKGKGAPLFSMALVTEIIDRIGFYHLLPETSMNLMATAAFDFPFVHRVMRLLILLGPNIFVAGVTEIGFLRFIGFPNASVNCMALITGDSGGSMFAHVP